MMNNHLYIFTTYILLKMLCYFFITKVFLYAKYVYV